MVVEQRIRPIQAASRILRMAGEMSVCIEWWEKNIHWDYPLVNTHLGAGINHPWPKKVPDRWDVKTIKYPCCRVFGNVASWYALALGAKYINGDARDGLRAVNEYVGFDFGIFADCYPKIWGNTYGKYAWLASYEFLGPSWSEDTAWGQKDCQFPIEITIEYLKGVATRLGQSKYGLLDVSKANEKYGMPPSVCMV